MFWIVMLHLGSNKWFIIIIIKYGEPSQPKLEMELLNLMFWNLSPRVKKPFLSQYPRNQCKYWCFSNEISPVSTHLHSKILTKQASSKSFQLSLMQGIQVQPLQNPFQGSKTFSSLHTLSCSKLERLSLATTHGIV